MFTKTLNNTFTIPQKQILYFTATDFLQIKILFN